MESRNVSPCQEINKCNNSLHFFPGKKHFESFDQFYLEWVIKLSVFINSSRNLLSSPSPKSQSPKSQSQDQKDLG